MASKVQKKLKRLTRKRTNRENRLKNKTQSISAESCDRLSGGKPIVPFQSEVISIKDMQCQKPLKSESCPPSIFHQENDRVIRGLYVPVQPYARHNVPIEKKRKFKTKVISAGIASMVAIGSFLVNYLPSDISYGSVVQNQNNFQKTKSGLHLKSSKSESKGHITYIKQLAKDINQDDPPTRLTRGEPDISAPGKGFTQQKPDISQKGFDLDSHVSSRDDMPRVDQYIPHAQQEPFLEISHGDIINYYLLKNGGRKKGTKIIASQSVIDKAWLDADQLGFDLDNYTSNRDAVLCVNQNNPLYKSIETLLTKSENKRDEEGVAKKDIAETASHVKKKLANKDFTKRVDEQRTKRFEFSMNGSSIYHFAKEQYVNSHLPTIVSSNILRPKTYRDYLRILGDVTKKNVAFTRAADELKIPKERGEYYPSYNEILSTYTYGEGKQLDVKTKDELIACARNHGASDLEIAYATNDLPNKTFVDRNPSDDKLPEPRDMSKDIHSLLELKDFIDEGISQTYGENVSSEQREEYFNTRVFIGETQGEVKTGTLGAYRSIITYMDLEKVTLAQKIYDSALGKIIGFYADTNPNDQMPGYTSKMASWRGVKDAVFNQYSSTKLNHFDDESSLEQGLSSILESLDAQIHIRGEKEVKLTHELLNDLVSIEARLENL